MNLQKVAKGLGWFSIGLGLAELVAPKKLGSMLQMADKSGLLRLYGIREIAVGIGILAVENRAPWLWARVGGDVLDLATLGWAITRPGRKGAPTAAVAAVAGVTALDVLCGKELRGKRLAAAHL